MYEFLKKLFGTNADGTTTALTYEQLVEKLGADKTIKLANLADGGYVSKDKFEAKETELSGLRDQLSEANKAIQSYKDMDIEGVKKSAAEWEKKYNEDTAALNKKLADNERAYNEDLFFRNYKFTSKAAENGIRAEFRSKNFTLEKGTFLGGAEYMTQLMADDDYKGAFAKDEPTPAPAPKATEPAAHKPKFADPTPNHGTPQKNKPSLMELMKYKNEHPDAEVKYN